LCFYTCGESEERNVVLAGGCGWGSFLGWEPCVGYLTLVLAMSWVLDLGFGHESKTDLGSARVKGSVQ
jgi:hypothetical protein